MAAVDVAASLLCPPLVGPVAPWDCDPGKDLPGLFASAAQSEPEAIAVASEGAADGSGEAPACSLTFRELRVRVSALAAELLHRVDSGLVRCGEQLLVAVCLPRAPALVAAILGVLEADGAYIPLEPSHPEARREFVLRDSGAALLVTGDSSSWTGSLAEHALVRLVLPSGELAAHSRLASPRGPQDTSHGRSGGTSGEVLLAYLIYTSGSTGTPKGVLVPRRGVRNVLHSFDGMLRAQGERGRHQAREDVLVSVTTVCFDISALEILWPTCFGFKLFLASAATARSGPRLSALLKEQQARFFQATPTTFRALLEAGWTGDRRLAALCGGESFPPALAPALFSRCGGGVWNVYGPTETTIWSTAYRITEGSLPLLARVSDSMGPRAVPIGGPIAGTAVLLRAADLAELPPDQPPSDEPAGTEASPRSYTGELLIGGVGVTRGYRSRPELTFARFLPWRDGPGLRGSPAVYCTGDLVRLPGGGGGLEFLGRLDQQVKLRGFRIELGEVEAALERHADVRAAVAVLRSLGSQAQADVSSELELVAFVLADATTRSALRAHLATLLPGYMVPKHIAFLQDLPVLPSGKVDRRALAERALSSDDLADQTHDEAFGAIAAELRSLDWPLAGDQDTASDGNADVCLRRAVAALVASVTGVQVQAEEEVDTDVGSLGVDSVTAVPLADLLSRHVLRGEEVPLEDLYVYSTLRGLCGYLRGRLRELTEPGSAEKLDAARAPSQAAGVAAAVATSDTGPALDASGAEAASATAGAAAAKRGSRRSLQLAREQKAKDRASGVKGAAEAMDPGLEACRDGDLEALRRLLDAKAFDPATKLDRFGGSGLHWAASAGHLEVCKALVEHRAAPGFADKKSGRSALHWCSRHGHLPVVRWLVEEHEQPVNVLTKDQTTPLQLAAWGGHVPTCEWLLSRGASLDHRNGWHCLPHHFAALAGMLEACKWLRSEGVDLGITNNQGHNALHKAAYGGHLELCEWLQDVAGLDPGASIADARGQTPVHLARKAGHEELAGWLMERASAHTGALDAPG